LSLSPETARPAGGWPALYQIALDKLGTPAEARWIAEEASGANWIDLIAGDQPVPGRAADRFFDMVARRQAGEPLQYVLGRWSFRHLDLMVDSRVLIPRPETEQVVDVALAELERLESGEPVVVDLGTGSGAIALSVAAERKRARVWATDASGPALEVARANLAGLAGFAATRVRMVEGDWWGALPQELLGRVDLVISNPPYISTTEMAQLDRQVAEWEPRDALEAGPDGLEAVEAILGPAPAWLTSSGTAVVEIAPAQAARAGAIATKAGFPDVAVVPDLAGRDRVLVARMVRA
jgi:release factor glutamine methyltransferase